MEEFHFYPKFPTIFGIPEIVAILESREFQSEEVSFFSKNNPHFSIPKFGAISEPREIQSEGVSNLSVKLSLLKELSRFHGE